MPTSELPKIACLCPTYKRPECLRNAVACFGWQLYPANRRVLCILDDAGIYLNAEGMHLEEGTNVLLQSQTERFPSIPAKFNALAKMVPDADVYAVWEDDDVYLPQHLSAIAAVWMSGAKFVGPEVFLSTYNCRFGEFVVERTGRGRMHGAWAYDGELFREFGGYDESPRLSFDIEMRGKMLARAGRVHSPFDNAVRPSYVYRWGRAQYNGSQVGPEAYTSFYGKLSEMTCPSQDWLEGKFDLETQLLADKLGIRLGMK